jgi:hypothetical protein
MGLSTDAYLFYGVDIDSAEEPIGNGVQCPPGITDEASILHFAKYGFEYTDESPLDSNSILEAYFAEQDWKVEIDSHCSGEYPIYFLCTKRHFAWRGEPQKIEEFEIGEAWNSDLAKALEAIGLAEQIPKIGWYLASYFSQ